MKIILRERRSTPVWLSPAFLADNYYRAEIPARMTGGAILRSFKVSIDGGAVEWAELSLAFFDRIKNCSALVVYGLGRPTIITSGFIRAGLPTPGEARFLDAVYSMPEFLFDFEDPPRKVLDIQAEADESTRLLITSIVTGETTMFTKILGVDIGPFARDVRQLWGNNRLPTPEEFLELHDVILEKTRSKLREGAQKTDESPSTLLRIRQVIAATVPLGDALLDKAPQLTIKVAENAVDPVDFRGARKPNDGKVRIGYSSQWTHKSDADLILPALRACARLPGVEVAFLGWHPGWSYDLCPDRPKQSIEFDGLTYHHGGLFADTRQFFRAVGILDVALAPLQNTFHNGCRGASKWFESAMHRTPMVLSDMPPYACVEHGITGFKARTAEEFTEYAVRLCQDAGLRKRIGDAAHDYVMEHHTTTACAGQWRAAVAC